MSARDEALEVLAPAASAERAVAVAAGRTAVPGGPRPGEFLAGDGIRGVAMICVILAHLGGGALLLDHVYDRGYRAGYGLMGGALIAGQQLALPMFFVLSAYLISRPYIRAYVLGTRMPSLHRYLRNRALRIVPVFWVVGAVMLALYGTLGSSVLDLAALFGFAQIYHASAASEFIGQAWTIDIEVAFYLLVPLSAYGITRATRAYAERPGGRELSARGRIALITGLLAVATAISVWLRASTVGTLWTQSPPATFYYFAPGVALAALELEFASLLARGRLPRLAQAFGLCAALLVVALAVAASSDNGALLHVTSALALAFASGSAFAALLVRQCARGDSPRWVDNRTTRWLGARSYPTYIVQSATVSAAVSIVGRVGGPWTELLALAVIALPLTIASGALVHAAIERPVLAWGRGRSHRAVARRA